MNRRPFHPSELDGADEARPSDATAADVLVAARELESLDTGAIRPSDGFADRVMAAIALEPLPAPMAVAGTAARQGRGRAMVAALRDTWHVAWSSGRPVAVRAQAMAFVLVLIVAVGSVSGLATIGAVGALFPAATPAVAHPTPSAPAVATPPPVRTATPEPSTEPTETPQPTETAEPSETPEPTETHEPAETEHPGTPGHTARPTSEPHETDDPSDDGGGDHGGGGSPSPDD